MIRVFATHGPAANELLFERNKGEDALREGVSSTGLWWMSPFGMFFGGTLIGQILSPRGDLMYGEASEQGTHCLVSRRDALVPIVFYKKRLAGTRSGWTNDRRQWSELKGPLTELHRALGGVDLGALESVLFDDPLMAADTDRGARREAEREIVGRLHPGDQMAEYLRLAELEASPSAPVAVRPGPWRRAACARAFQRRLDADIEDEETAELAWEFHQGPGQVDAAFEDPTAVLGWPSYVTMFHLSKFAARLTGRQILPRRPELQKDPWGRLVGRMAGAGYGTYDGLAHMETAAVLDLEGRPEDAWDALVTAALWSKRHSNTVLPSIRDAALFLAQTRGWDRIAEAMTR